MSFTDGKSIERAAAILRERFGSDWGVVDIRPMNRFGESVIAVQFASREDVERLRLEFGKATSCQIYFQTQIWSIGGLIKGNTERAEKVLLAPVESRDVQAMKRRQQLVDEFSFADQKVWDAWSPKERRAYLRNFIKEKRERDPGYANCGDKFLLPD
jgi:hypothetical protein